MSGSSVAGAQGSPRNRTCYLLQKASKQSATKAMAPVSEPDVLHNRRSVVVKCQTQPWNTSKLPGLWLCGAPQMARSLPGPTSRASSGPLASNVAPNQRFQPC